MSTNEPAPGHGKLSLWDTVSIIIGIVIGSSIFTTPPVIFGSLPGPWTSLALWLLCGVLSLIGAFVYAELATAYPRAGGDYVYLTRAFGRPVGFLFGWANLVSILSGSIGFMAFVFAVNAMTFVEPHLDASANKEEVRTWIALGALGLISLLNILGVVLGKLVQNALVVVKLLGVGLIVAVGFAYGAPGQNLPVSTDLALPTGTGLNYGLAIILILYAYGGWNDAAFIASDLQQPKQIAKALLLGTAGITGVYLLVNAAYIAFFGYDEVSKFRPAIAADLLGKSGLFGDFKVMPIIVMISALGAMNGMIFTGSRVYSSLGSDHRVFAFLAKYHPQLGAPIFAILIQTFVVALMIVSVGTSVGRDAIDNALRSVSLEVIPWERYFGGFDTLFAGTAPVFWLFFLLTGIAFFVLRAKDPNLARPFRLPAPWYPLLPLIFCATCIFGFYSAITYAKMVSLIGWIPLLLGVPLYFLSGKPQQESRS